MKMKVPHPNRLPVWLLAATIQCTHSVLLAAGAVEAWVQRYGDSSGGLEIAEGIVVDSRNGNAYVAGTTYFTNSASGCATIAYSRAGIPLWTNLYRTQANSSDAADAIAVDSAVGNVYVVGHFGGIRTLAYSLSGESLWTNVCSVTARPYGSASAICVDSGTGNVYVTGTLGGMDSDYATIAYARTGLPLWTNSYAGPLGGDNQSLAMSLDASGNVYVTGVATSASIGYPAYEYGTIAYSSSGMALWTNRYGGVGGPVNVAVAMAVDRWNSHVFVTGYSDGFGGVSEYATIAYASSGTGLWTNRYAPAAGVDASAEAIAVGANGNVYVTGAADGCVTIAYSSSGTPLWTNRFAGVGLGIAADPAGNPVVFAIGGSNTNFDCFTVAYSAEGAALWTNRYDGPAHADDRPENPRSIAIDSRGAVYVLATSDGLHGTVTNSDLVTIKYVPAPEMVLAGINWLSNSGAQLSITAPTNTPFVLEASGDLENWMTLTNFPPLPVTSLQYTDTLASSYLNRFYRTSWNPQ